MNNKALNKEIRDGIFRGTFKIITNKPFNINAPVYLTSDGYLTNDFRKGKLVGETKKQTFVKRKPLDDVSIDNKIISKETRVKKVHDILLNKQVKIEDSIDSIREIINRESKFIEHPLEEYSFDEENISILAKDIILKSKRLIEEMNDMIETYQVSLINIEGVLSRCKELLGEKTSKKKDIDEFEREYVCDFDDQNYPKPNRLIDGDSDEMDLD